jgi:hypothetical protein
MTQNMDDASGKMTRQRVIEMAAKALEISVDEAKQMPWEEIHGVATRAPERAVTRARDDLADLDALSEWREEHPW